MKNRFFESFKFNSYITRITGLAGENCYLIEGKERALLIDGLTGAASLKAFVRELTDLPIIVALTHGHLDHTGAAWEYGKCFIHPADIPLMYSKEHSSQRNRLSFLTSSMNTERTKRAALKLEDIVPPCPVKTFPIFDGDIFDLGGIQIEAIGIPGHSRGSMVYLDRKSQLLFSGDACNANTLLGLDGSTSVEEYAESLIRFKRFKGTYSHMYGGHGEFAVPASIVDDAIALCVRIMNGEDDAIETKLPGNIDAFLAAKRGSNYLPESGGYANIVYRMDHVRRDKQSRVITGYGM